MENYKKVTRFCSVAAYEETPQSVCVSEGEKERWQAVHIKNIHWSAHLHAACIVAVVVSHCYLVGWTPIVTSDCKDQCCECLCSFCFQSTNLRN